MKKNLLQRMDYVLLCDSFVFLHLHWNEDGDLLNFILRGILYIYMWYCDEILFIRSVHFIGKRTIINGIMGFTESNSILCIHCDFESIVSRPDQIQLVVPILLSFRVHIHCALCALCEVKLSWMEYSRVCYPFPGKCCSFERCKERVKVKVIILEHLISSY